MMMMITEKHSSNTLDYICLCRSLLFTSKLDDNMAMSPAAKMSLFPKLIISARISKSGQAAPAAGDLTGESAPVDKNATGVVIEIKDVVGK